MKRRECHRQETYDLYGRVKNVLERSKKTCQGDEMKYPENLAMQKQMEQDSCIWCHRLAVSPQNSTA